MYKILTRKQFKEELPLEKMGFYWNGVGIHCFYFYKIYELNSRLYLKKWKGYENGRAIYEEIDSFYYNVINLNQVEVELNEFKKKLKVCLRETKFKKLQGYFKKDNKYYSKLHSKNR